MCIANPGISTGIEKTLASLFPLRGDTAPPVACGAPRRRKLWEIGNKYHCPIVGTCLTVDELRKLARRADLERLPFLPANAAVLSQLATRLAGGGPR